MKVDDEKRVLEEAKKKAAQEEEERLKLKVVRFHPTSQLSSNTIEAIMISFNHPIAKENQVEIKKIDLGWTPTITPSLSNGHWELKDTTTIQFVSNTETHLVLPNSTLFTIEVPTKAVSLAGRYLENAFSFTFTSPTMKILSIQTQDAHLCYPLRTGKFEMNFL